MLVRGRCAAERFVRLADRVGVGPGSHGVHVGGRQAGSARRDCVTNQTMAAAGLSRRITVASGDFFAEPLPRADVTMMGRILHD
jgi:hypothetical protein